jgi:hypothetical protein
MPKQYRSSDRFQVEQRVPMLLDLIQWLHTGKSLLAWCDDRDNGDKPSPATVYRWLEDEKAKGNDHLAREYARARVAGGCAMAEEALEIADKPVAALDDGRIDPSVIALRKLQIEQRMRMAAAYCPDVFGQRAMKVALGGDPDGVPIQLDATSRSARIQALVTAAAARRLQVEVGKPRQLPDDDASEADDGE